MFKQAAPLLGWRGKRYPLLVKPGEAMGSLRVLIPALPVPTQHPELPCARLLLSVTCLLRTQ